MPDPWSDPHVPGAGSRAAEGGGVLHAGWREGLAVVNLRGDPGDPGFVHDVEDELGVALPAQAEGTAYDHGLRVVWAGPDDWFLIGPPGLAGEIVAALRTRLAGRHVAVTDVSCGYTVLRLAGASARDALAQGCPMDLHPRVFGPGRCAGTHYFKASVWLWQVDDAPTFELLVRRSFMDYAWLMLERASAECGLKRLPEFRARAQPLTDAAARGAQ